MLKRNGSPSNVSVGSGGLLVSQGCCMEVGWTIIEEMVGMSFRMAGGQGAGLTEVSSVELGKETQEKEAVGPWEKGHLLVSLGGLRR